MTSEVKADLRIELSDLNYPGIHVHVASNSHVGGLWCHDGLQMTSEVKADLNYLWCNALLAYKGFPEMIETQQQTANYDP